MSEPAIALATRDFRHAVMLAGKAVASKSTIPILSMVRCRANGTFEATGTDLDLTVIAKVPRSGNAEGEFMLPDYRTILGALATAGGDAVELGIIDGGARISSDALAIDAQAKQLADDFPVEYGIAAETFAATLSHAHIRSLLRVFGAVSQEETRYYLNGIYIHHLAGATYRAVATDGHRLHWLDLQLLDAQGELPGIIIPRQTLKVLFNLTSGRPAQDDRGITMRAGNLGNSNSMPTTTAPEGRNATRVELAFNAGPAKVMMVSKLIDGTFPNYSRVIPQAPKISMLFKAAELRRAVEAVSLGSKGKRAVSIAPDTRGAVISAQHLPEGIGTSVRVGCTHNWNGEPVGYNGGYLLALLDASGVGDEIIIAPDDQLSNSPALVRNPADTAWGAVIMPVRL